MMVSDGIFSDPEDLYSFKAAMISGHDVGVCGYWISRQIYMSLLGLVHLLP
jgi:hypothetical protein